MAPSIPTYGSGYTLAFPQAAAAEVTPVAPPEKGLSSASSSPWSSSLRELMAVSSGAERGRLMGVVFGLQGWFLPQPKRRVRALGLSLGADWQGTCQGRSAAVPSAWPARTRDSPLGPRGTGTASGPAPQRASSKGCWAEGRRAGLRMGGAVTPVAQCHRPATPQSQCPGAG